VPGAASRTRFAPVRPASVLLACAHAGRR
jgi:hypothetical protein